MIVSDYDGMDTSGTASPPTSTLTVFQLSLYPYEVAPKEVVVVKQNKLWYQGDSRIQKRNMRNQSKQRRA